VGRGVITVAMRVIGLNSRRRPPPEPPVTTQWMRADENSVLTTSPAAAKTENSVPRVGSLFCVFDAFK